MRKQNLAKIMICIMAAITLVGCKEAETVPELLEPAAVNQAFRPAERRNIGNIKVSVGNVVAKEYFHSYKKVTTIKEICFNVGDHVEEGDVLAVSDVKALKEELEDISDQRTLLTALHDARQPLYGLTLDMIDVDKRSAVNIEDNKRAAEIDNEINIEKENQFYDEKIYEYQMKQLNKRAADINEQITDGTLKAKTSGTVTYIKDTGKDNVAKINEAVVVIANDSEVFIEAPDQTTEAHVYKKYEVKYALIEGKEVPITEYEYTEDEIAYTKAQKTYPNIRYKTDTKTNLKPGDTVIMCYIQKDQTNAIAVGQDSLNADDGGNYVYVRGEGDRLEKRYVTLGASDEYYTAVLDGLEEGEDVFYIQEIAAPIKYTEYTVENTDYTQTYETPKLKKGETLNQAYFAPCLGTVEDILVDAGDVVEEGDVLMVIDTGGGASAIQDAVNEKAQAKADYDKRINELDGQSYDTDASKEITIIEAGMFHMCEPEYLFAMERAQIQQKMVYFQKELAKAEYDATVRACNRRISRVKKDNDGTGRVNIVADSSGTVSKIFVKKGSLIKEDGENKLLLSLTKNSEDMIAVSVSRILSLSTNGRLEGVVPVGAKVRVQGGDENDKTIYTGTCVCNAWNGKCYVSTEDEKVQSASVIDEDNKDCYVYVKMDDPEFNSKININKATAYLDTMQGKDMIVIPSHLIYEEESKTGKKVRYFVWKIQNGKPVKQYVIRGNEYGLGNEIEAVIIQGLSEGDILANERGQ